MGINLGNLAPEPTVDIKAEAAGVAPAAPVAEPVLPSGVEKVDRGGGVVSLNLSKGISLDLSKTMPTLDKLTVGLGWDTTADLDVFALALHNGKVLSGNDVIFFNQKNAVAGINLMGDCRNGALSEGDDESIKMVLSQIPADVDSVAIFVNIFQATNQNFGMVKGAYCRIVNDATNKEEAIYILNESDAALYNAFHFVTFKRNATGWSFDTVAKGMNGDINTIANQFC